MNIEVFDAASACREYPSIRALAIRDLNKIVRNFRRFYELYELEVPLKISFDDDRAFLEGVSRFGTVTQLQRRGLKLFANIECHQPHIAEAIQDRSRCRVTVEIYLDYRGQGPGLRSVVLLPVVEEEPLSISSLRQLLGGATDGAAAFDGEGKWRAKKGGSKDPRSSTDSTFLWW